MSDEDPRKIISSALISSPKGVTLFRLLQDYREFTGQDVPFRKMGFASFEQYLLSIPETCRLAGYGRNALVIPVVNAQNKHINEMILKQKAPKSNPRSRQIKRSRGIYDSSASFQNTLDYIPRPVEPEINFKLPVINPNSHLITLPPPQDYYYRGTQRKIYRPQPVQQNIEPSSSKSNECTSNSTKPIVRDTTQNVTATVQQDAAAAAELSSEESDYDEFFSELNYNDDEDDFYYKSDSDSVDLSTSTANLHSFVLKKEDSIPMLDPEEFGRQDHISRVNDNVKEKLRLLISEHPDGIWCSKLLKMYRERFKQMLDPLDFGFASVIQLCDDIPDVFHCIRPNRMDWKLYDSRKPVPDVHSLRDLSKYLQSLAVEPQNLSNSEPALPNGFVNLNPSYKYPENVLHPDEIIERQWIPENKQIDDYLEVIVAEVYDPSKLWVQLKGEDTFDALQKLMDDMQVFYMHNAGTLQLNEFSVRIGLFVAALFMNEYHRAVVIKVFCDQTLKVFYIDYGTVAEVPLRKTCFLHRDFSVLPQQAIRSRLDNIVPVEQNTMWPREAAQFMLNMVMEKTLFGLIRQIEKEPQILHLILTDTTQEHDIHINDELVNAGYAALGNEAPLCATSSAIVPNVHLYPSFEEIENYIYPSVSDVGRLLKLGQTYETIFHGYFSHATCARTPELLSFSQNTDHSRCDSNVEESMFAAAIDDEEMHSTKCDSKAVNVISDIETPPPPIIVCNKKQTETTVRVKPFNPPPGFENIKPNVNNFVENTKPETENVPIPPLMSLPLMQNPLVPVQHFSGAAAANHLNQWVMNQPPILNVAMVNPFVYNQMLVQREVMLQQHREAMLSQQREALFQHQFEEFQRVLAAKNYAAQQGSQHNSPSPKNMYDHFINHQDENENVPQNNNDSLSNQNEHICTRNVIELTFNNYNLHVLKIEEQYYVITQEIITTLLNSNLSLKNWLRTNDLTINLFPNILINLTNFPELYNELIKYTIPGLLKANNLGCNIRVTLLNDVIDIVYKYGDRNIIPELKINIKNATESQYLWEVLHSSD